MVFSGRPSISAVVPVHNGRSVLRTCLSSLAAAVPSPDEIVVVDDGSTDASPRLAQELGVRLIELPVRGGPARARNVGARAARGDILFFVDADVAIRPDAVGQIVDTFARQSDHRDDAARDEVSGREASDQHEPDLAAVFGSYDDTPAEVNFLSQYKNLLHHYVHQTAREEASTFWAGCGAVRRDVFLAVDGFDESYGRPCIEDIELGYRLKRAGYRIWLNKALQGTHLKHWGTVSLLKAD